MENVLISSLNLIIKETELKYQVMQKEYNINKKKTINLKHSRKVYYEITGLCSLIIKILDNMILKKILKKKYIRKIRRERIKVYKIAKISSIILSKHFTVTINNFSNFAATYKK